MRLCARRILSPSTGHKEAALRPTLALTLATALGGCATAPGTLPSQASGPTCVQLFQQFDLIQASMSTPTGRRDAMVIPPDLQPPAERLRNAGCITLSADLAGMDAAAGPPVVNSGLAIAPVSLHAGVVTNMADDANARAFFEAHGVPARSIGSPGLGRRIYVGPFQTQGTLDGARDLAVRAGFAYPYPAQF